MSKRALFLISDTGGGHRSASEAIASALDDLHGPPLEHRIEDVAAHCSFPLTQLGLAYSAALRFAPPVYGALYHATNGRRRYRTIVRFCEPLYRERLQTLFRSYRPDVIVSVHPLLNHAALRARSDANMLEVPIVTVITDLGKVHESWLSPQADAVVVPAREVYERALSRGVRPERLHLLGHPIDPKFEDTAASKEEARHALGLPRQATIALLMAGGEGGGKLLPTTLALARARLKVHLVVVTARNAALKTKLEELAPSLATPLTILGYSDQIPLLMRASDVLITKAGPGTIAEANVAAVPTIVYDYVPGQERGNVDYVRENGIGIVALSTPAVVNALAGVIANPLRLDAMRAKQRAIARHGSARRIAQLIAGMTGEGSRRPVGERHLAATV